MTKEEKNAIKFLIKDATDSVTPEYKKQRFIVALKAFDLEDVLECVREIHRSCFQDAIDEKVAEVKHLILLVEERIRWRRRDNEGRYC